MTRKKKYTLKPVHKRLQELLREDIFFIESAIGRTAERKVKKMKNGDIIMLENLRLYKEEEENNQLFAEKLAKLGDVYVGEHFSVCHRANSSIVALPKMMPHFAGQHFLKEIEMLSMIFNHPIRPLVAVIGGAKVQSKIKVGSN